MYENAILIEFIPVNDYNRNNLPTNLQRDLANLSCINYTRRSQLECCWNRGVVYLI